MQKTTLVVMAAGIGSRFGEGIKQLTSVGPNGEIIVDYSVHDALEAGFNKIIFIIRKDIHQDFDEIIGHRLSKKCEIEYAFQELNDIPKGYNAFGFFYITFDEFKRIGCDKWDGFKHIYHDAQGSLADGIFVCFNKKKNSFEYLKAGLFDENLKFSLDNRVEVFAIFRRRNTPNPITIDYVKDGVAGEKYVLWERPEKVEEKLDIRPVTKARLDNAKRTILPKNKLHTGDIVIGDRLIDANTYEGFTMVFIGKDDLKKYEKLLLSYGYMITMKASEEGILFKKGDSDSGASCISISVADLDNNLSSKYITVNYILKDVNQKSELTRNYINSLDNREWVENMDTSTIWSRYNKKYAPADNVSESVNEKLNIRPVSRERLHGIKKYDNIYDSDNFIECPKTFDETTYALANALFATRLWINPKFDKYDYYLMYDSNSPKGIRVKFEEIRLQLQREKLEKCKWSKKITSQSIYDSAIDILYRNGEAVCQAASGLMEIAPKIGLCIIHDEHNDVIHSLYEIDDFGMYDGYIKYTKSYFVARFLKSIVRPQYQKYADKEYFEGELAKDLTKDIYGNDVKYLEVIWNRDSGLLMEIDGKLTPVKFSDFVDGLDNISL